MYTLLANVCVIALVFTCTLAAIPYKASLLLFLNLPHGVPEAIIQRVWSIMRHAGPLSVAV